MLYSLFFNEDFTVRNQAVQGSHSYELIGFFSTRCRMAVGAGLLKTSGQLPWQLYSRK